MTDLGEGPRGPATSPLFWVKNEGMTEGRRAGWASKLKPSPLLSSKSGSATEKDSNVDYVYNLFICF